ncbi:hypothetical protein SLS62_006089 [Diatrype stigma]|uniref:DUF7907 domain-containing protein n=1 Tax=Diatrype stigma TaxID=117547 RepID=A0AAN9UQ19_9PEZI
MAAIKSLLTAALLMASTISAAAIPASASASAPRNYPTTPQSFRLTAQTLSASDLTPSVDGREVGFTKRNATEGALVLVPSTNLTGAVFAPGTLETEDGSAPRTVSASTFECPRQSSRQPAAGVVVYPGGTFTIPSARTVDLRCGAATPGVAVVPDPTRTPGAGEALGFQEGVWMACEGPRMGLSEGIVAIGFRTPTQRPLVGCVDVRLVPVYV